MRATYKVKIGPKATVKCDKLGPQMYLKHANESNELLPNGREAIEMLRRLKTVSKIVITSTIYAFTKEIFVQKLRHFK